MSNLNEYRDQIDRIDRELTPLFEQRMDVVLNVARYKLENNMEVFQSAREAQVLEKVQGLLKNHDYDAAVREFYLDIMSISKDYQRKLLRELRPKAPAPDVSSLEGGVIGYQGVEGSFSEQALTEFFGPGREKCSAETFEKLCLMVHEGEIRYGVLPVENSITGSVFESYDLLEKYNLCVVGERIISVQQHLMAPKGTALEDIEEVYSHGQGIAQCAGFLKNYPNWKLIPYYNTAISAKFVAEKGDGRCAAIASAHAANIYGLEILEHSINDVQDNNTRFLIIAQRSAELGGDKATAVFTLKNEPGALAAILDAFAAQSINMTKIESRPIAKRPFEYRFYVDFSGELGDGFKQAVQAALPHAEQWRLLGAYKAHHKDW